MARIKQLWDFINLCVSPLFRMISVVLTILSIVALVRDEGPREWAKYKFLRYLPDWRWQTWLILFLVVFVLAFVEGAYRLYQKEQQRGKPLFDAFDNPLEYKNVPPTRFTNILAALILTGIGMAWIYNVIYEPEPVKTPQLKPETSEAPPTLSDLFKSDLGSTLKITTEDSIKVPWENGDVTPIKAQLYTDFDAKVKFLGFYVPPSGRTYEICLRLVEAVEASIQNFQKNIGVSSGYRDERNKLQDLIFSGRVLIYHEDFLSIPEKAAIIQAYSAKHFDVQFRGPDYLADQVIAWHRQHNTKSAH